MTFVRGVIARAALAASMHQVSGSTSTKMGVAQSVCSGRSHPGNFRDDHLVTRSDSPGQAGQDAMRVRLEVLKAKRVPIVSAKRLLQITGR